MSSQLNYIVRMNSLVQYDSGFDVVNADDISIKKIKLSQNQSKSIQEIRVSAPQAYFEPETGSSMTLTDSNENGSSVPECKFITLFNI